MWSSLFGALFKSIVSGIVDMINEDKRDRTNIIRGSLETQVGGLKDALERSIKAQKVRESVKGIATADLDKFLRRHR